jgi:hypothetical protein
MPCRARATRWPASRSAYGQRRRSALPPERLISRAALARSRAKSSPAVYSASSKPPLNPVMSQTAALVNVPPRTLKASTRTQTRESPLHQRRDEGDERRSALADHAAPQPAVGNEQYDAARSHEGAAVDHERSTDALIPGV